MKLLPGVEERSVTLESQTYFNHALEQINRNNYRKALDHLMEAIQIVPGRPQYVSFFGYCIAMVHHDYQRAVRLCRQAAVALPMDPALHVNLGKVLRLQGDNAAAHRAFLDAWKASNKRDALAAAELTRMGVRRPPFLPFLSRSNWCNKYLGMIRATVERKVLGRRAC